MTKLISKKLDKRIGRNVNKLFPTKLAVQDKLISKMAFPKGNWEKVGRNDYQKYINGNWNILWYGQFATGYGVTISNSKERRILKSGLKTKSQAVAYVKRFMREN